jgi:hypothetical protein
MKYKKGDKVVFVKNPHELYGWILINYQPYEIDKYWIDINGIIGDKNSVYYIVNGDIYSWYHESNFISIKESRKLKLNKLYHENKN